MANVVTVTGKFGPGLTVTAKVFPNASEVRFNFDRTMVYITNNGTTEEFDINAAATITMTVTAGVYALTIS